MPICSGAAQGLRAPAGPGSPGFLCAASLAVIGWGWKPDDHNQGTLGSGKPLYGPLRSQRSFLLIAMNRGLCKIPQVLPKPTPPAPTHTHTLTHTVLGTCIYRPRLPGGREGRRLGRWWLQLSAEERAGARPEPPAQVRATGETSPALCPPPSAGEGWRWGPCTLVPHRPGVGRGLPGRRGKGGGEGRSPGDTGLMEKLRVR